MAATVVGTSASTRTGRTGLLEGIATRAPAHIFASSKTSMAGAPPGNRTSSTDAVRACGGGSLYVVAQPASHSAPPTPAAIVRIVMRPPAFLLFGLPDRPPHVKTARGIAQV
uniref:Uncharacterized protein n=1 Tax=Ralstonia solanacearum TaxID=305 RepID=A0A0S4W8H4_RALSL|nr:conserved protein of unknown function [Ralstonia solanacearum]